MFVLHCGDVCVWTLVWVWQHSVSEGELRENLMALSSTSSMLQGVSVEDRRLRGTDGEDATHCELQDEEENESESDDMITEDFSSSMISCWSFRAKTLLQLNMVRCLLEACMTSCSTNTLSTAGMHWC